MLLQTGTQINPRALAILARGELLCQAFEVYQQLLPSHGIGFEHAVFLVTALADGVELTVARCAECAVLCKGRRKKDAARRIPNRSLTMLQQRIPHRASESCYGYHDVHYESDHKICENSPDGGAMQPTGGKQIVSHQCEWQ